MGNDKIKELECNLWDQLEKYFPKGKHKDRGKALVLIAMSREMGVQGHADHIKNKCEKSKFYCTICEEHDCDCQSSDRFKIVSKGCGNPFQEVYKENSVYPDDYLICGFSKIGDETQLCDKCKGETKEWTKDEKFHLDITRILCDNDTGELSDRHIIEQLMQLNIKHLDDTSQDKGKK